MEQHTPGPWATHSGSVYKDEPKLFPKGGSQSVVGIPICHMDRISGNGTTPPERDANARLIAASPFLLQTLEAIAGMTVDEDTDHAQLSALLMAMAKTAAQATQ